VISAPRDEASLKSEIVTMRNRVRTAHTIKPGLFDVKHSPGGMVDAEFAVQYLVLMQACAHPELADNVGNIALLQRAEVAGLLSKCATQSAAE
jgi:glutamate-ammonia-ligase adenylyltransferase